MNIIVPKHSGFCHGVKRSVKEAYALAGKGNAFMYGEVVHNPVVMANLMKCGISPIQDLTDVTNDSGKNPKLLIRAHGVPVSVLEEAAKRGIEIIDMTCHHVKKIHAIVANASARGMDVIVCGTHGHPEVQGHLSRVKTQVVTVQDLDEARRIIPGLTFSKEGVCLVAQTTHNKRTYEEVRAFLAKECANIPFLEPFDTICGATAHRQDEIRELAKTADACIIVGGRNSSNVTKLYEIAREYCARTQHIESADQLDYGLFRGAETVVIAGGASTPDESVREVVRKTEGLSGE
ncbi:MAG: 4-hydroxy-3-methylbut-2-enyl diphosphate reductase [Defluviitaleaceae bacterium]|nr:4-hydroxy-3-methylbut-2-enyl diphosphate reductase [Defluviitaleaceae bacterium]